ncbi:hypothetical protein LCGC14_2943640, partial [marine sediment metagenome]
MNQAQLEGKIIARIIAFEHGKTDHYERLKEEIREIIEEHFAKSTLCEICGTEKFDRGHCTKTVTCKDL